MARRQRVVEEDEIVNPSVARVLQAEMERQEMEGQERYETPVVYYNPVCIHERYRLPGTSYFRRFAAGRAEVNFPSEEKMVRNVLASYGAGKADRWKGNNRGTEEHPKFWDCKKCNFISANDESIEDHREALGH
jgi:hypothetical protein